MNGMWQGKGAHDAARTMSEMECAWFAGLFDGEGSVIWPRRQILHSVRLDVTNTCKPLIDRVSEVTGTGRVLMRERKSDRHSLAYVWHAYGDNARSILRQILPWLIVKKQAAEVALGIIEVDEAPWTQRTRTMRAAP